MEKGQLMSALLTVQSSAANFAKLGPDFGPMPAMTSACELYSDGLLEYLNKNMRPMPVVDFFQGTFSFADFFDTEGWDHVVRPLHARPCVLVGRSKPIECRNLNDIEYESFVGTYVDEEGYVFNAEVRQYCLKLNGEFTHLVTRHGCADAVLRLDVVEEFFPEKYSGFWS
ncbi:MAG: hypothetical protein HDQ88_04435 [Clostridia bacterium]|nr:hypothetical protein [Clostridia bacterium]